MPYHVPVSILIAVNFTLEDSFAALIILPPPVVFYFHLTSLYLTSQSFTNSDLRCILCSTLCFNSVPITVIQLTSNYFF